MIRVRQTAAQLKLILNGSVHADEALRVNHGFESPHPAFQYSGWSMR
jgi:hypothetical protein